MNPAELMLTPFFEIPELADGGLDIEGFWRNFLK